MIRFEAPEDDFISQHRFGVKMKPKMVGRNHTPIKINELKEFIYLDVDLSCNYNFINGKQKKTPRN